ncbi:MULTISPECIES: S41 family peptidase [Streptomyces]|uniref:PDZ domain-containing protein n=1 Tax=Streptomyces koelreuteriae TaxID=2838015 RepID=A0ABX8FVX3_9ACTN|nr:MULTISPECIES: S41 family peptidase [Streptomyces]QWB25237.1 PDZ domain-containing protein [Streptomyces koelreuteriae]UUA08273.1 S41 family peptidase [Streptomyces koelreuteriae]UUA15879.1 S41 family peptidase [Streptomyces sp. CRCS-T-1]
MSGRDPFCQPRRIRRGAALTLLFTSVLVAGAATGSLPQADRKSAPDEARSATPAGRHADVARAAEEAMADGKSPMEAAKRAVSRSGDRWGAVYSEGEYEEFEESLDGQYTGVGLWARSERDGRIEVTKVRSGSPAAGAGIRPGDLLRSVDGEKTDGRPVTEVVSLLRGDAGGATAGTTVRLGLERGTRAWSETLRRARLSTDPVSVREAAGSVTVIRVDTFTKGSGERVREAVRRAPRGAGIVLDLRANSGGLVTEAVTAASAFLDGGLVATYDVDGEQRALHADPGGDTTRPLVALVDGGTMSAAELLTGAVQDRGRALVVGSRTFGKGSVQMPSRLPDGSVAELTVGHYRTPSGRGVDGRGITPDLEVEDGAERRAETVLTGLGPPS